jgi:hypothetical protein
MSELWKEKNLSINNFFLFDHSYDFVLSLTTRFMKNHHFLIENNVGIMIYNRTQVDGRFLLSVN